MIFFVQVFLKGILPALEIAVLIPISYKKLEMI